MAAVQPIEYPSVKWRPYIMLGIGVFVGSIGIIFIRNAQTEVPTIAIAAMRFVLTSILLTPLVLNRYQDQLRQLTAKDFIFTALAGVMFALGMTTRFESLNYTTVLISGVIGGSMPLWVALIEKSVLKTTLHRNVWIGLALALAGTTVISINALTDAAALGSQPLIGLLLALSSAFGSAAYFTLGRSVRPRVSLLPYIWLLCIFAAITSLLITAVTSTQLGGYSLESYFWILLITLGPQLTVQSSVNYALAYFSATVVGLVMQLTIVGNAVAALIVYHQVPLPPQLIGSAIILAGVTLANLRKRT